MSPNRSESTGPWRLVLPWPAPLLRDNAITNVARSCDNQSGSEGAANAARSLTHLLDLGERGLAVKATSIRKSCIEAGCNSPTVAHQRCDLHYRRARRTGMLPPRPTLAERLWSWVSVTPNGCWEWQGATDRGGYGRIGSGRNNLRMAHRVAYELRVGPIAEGMQLDHLCRNRACCNPAHLEPVTPRENTLRGQGMAARRALRSTCPAGHPYSGDNLFINRRGSRECRICRRINSLARYHKGKAAR